MVLDLIGTGLTPIIEAPPKLAAAGLLIVSAVFSSVTDNIPLAAMLAKILEGREALGTPVSEQLWWSVIFGANLGGNLTPIGSASTLVAVTIIHKYELKLTFVGFIRKAFPFALVHIALAIVYVLLFFPSG